MNKFFRRGLSRQAFSLITLLLGALVFIAYLSDSLAYYGISSVGGHIDLRNVQTVKGLEDTNLEQKCDLYMSTLWAHSTSLFNSRQNHLDPYMRMSQIRNFVQHLRIFSKCFTDTYLFENFDHARELEKLLYPMYTQWLPVYVKWDSIFKNYTREDYYKSNAGACVIEQEETKCYGQKKKSFLAQLRHDMRGAGIAISAGDKQVDNLIRLIRVLRYLENDLPIQIVHKGDLSFNSQAEIVYESRAQLWLRDDLYLNKSKQNVFFVDASRSLNKEWASKFQEFSNKWVATLFNSFDDMILMDVDTVPFIQPVEFLGLKGYNKTQALFFQDRSLPETLSRSAIDFYKSLLPSQMEHHLFNIANTTSVTLENVFFTEFRRHIMESGVVLMRRSKYLVGLFVSSRLQMWVNTNQPVWGDKDLFWLGQSIVGNEQYTFNRNNAAAIGTLKDDGVTQYICSIQPAQFDDENRLLWLNGGLRFCKLDTWKEDFKNFSFLRKKFKGVDALCNYYKTTLKVDAAILTKERLDASSALKSKNKLSYGWYKNEMMGCQGYVWCARLNPLNANEELKLFDSKEITNVNSIAKVWNSL